MPRIELIFNAGCPHVDLARDSLRKALAEARLPRQWTEWERRAAGGPEYAAAYGSPTILVNGRDVGGDAPGRRDCCRLYWDVAGGWRGAPTVAQIATAVRRAVNGRASDDAGDLCRTEGFRIP